VLLSRSHLHYIKKEKDRRARVISARLCREFGSTTTSLYIKMIKRHMSLELNQRFGIQRLEQMEDVCSQNIWRRFITISSPTAIKPMGNNEWE
jgi:hypothetical protein